MSADPAQALPGNRSRRDHRHFCEVPVEWSRGRSSDPSHCDVESAATGLALSAAGMNPAHNVIRLISALLVGRSVDRTGIVHGHPRSLCTLERLASLSQPVCGGTSRLSRTHKYFLLGARFAKWRAVTAIGDRRPSWGCIEAIVRAMPRSDGVVSAEGVRASPFAESAA